MKTLSLSLLQVFSWCSAPAQAARDERVIAVLTRAESVYMEAFSAFQAAYGSEIRYYDLSEGAPSLPKEARTIVTFGGKAASFRYPEGTKVIYAMAPGLQLSRTRYPGAVKISMLPPVDRVLKRLRSIQPGMRTLAIFWTADRYAPLVEEAGLRGREYGVSVYAVRIKAPGDLPAAIRAENGRMDAIWLPPDPLLLTPSTLRIFTSFAWGNAVPLYGSTRGMTREGAAASVGVTVKAVGTAAAEAARRIEAGETLPDTIYPETEDLTLNASSARRCGLGFSRELVERAEYLFP
ncbi:MAG TPA: ABC transporter substrate binding protein [Elusimicrobiales bacterium]|nr:ABC transporter substrate binding protein [Elusimicrobiales bacterium]